MGFLASTIISTASYADTLRDSFRGFNGGVRVIDSVVTEGDTTTFTITTTNSRGRVKTKTFTATRNGDSFDISGNGREAFKDWLSAHAMQAQNINTETISISNNEIAFNAFKQHKIDTARASGSIWLQAYESLQYDLSNDYVQLTENQGIAVDYGTSPFADLDLTEGTASNISVSSDYNFLQIPGLQEVHNEGWTGEGARVIVRDFFRPGEEHGPIVANILEGVAPGAEINRSSEGTWITDVPNHDTIDIINLSQGQDLRLDFDDQVLARNDRGEFARLPHLAKKFENANIVKSAGNGGDDIFKIPGVTSTASYNNFCVKAGNNHTTDSCTDLKFFYDAVDNNVQSNVGHSADIIDQYPQYYASLENTKSRLIIVGATHDGETLTDYSNAAGERAMNDYIVANGRCEQWNYTYGGTSCSAPRVSGALALVKQKFPNLTAAERKHLILHTADDLGAEGVDPVFGHGLLNVGRALSPMGNIN